MKKKMSEEEIGELYKRTTDCYYWGGVFISFFICGVLNIFIFYFNVLIIPFTSVYLMVLIFSFYITLKRKEDRILLLNKLKEKNGQKKTK